jgi:hypothetical protein
MSVSAALGSFGVVDPPKVVEAREVVAVDPEVVTEGPEDVVMPDYKNDYVVEIIRQSSSQQVLRLGFVLQI